MVVEVVDTLENVLSLGELRNDAAAEKSRMDKATRGNNIEYILDGTPLPEKKDMKPYIIYVYKNEKGELCVDSKQNKGKAESLESVLTISNQEAIEQDARDRLVKALAKDSEFKNKMAKFQEKDIGTEEYNALERELKEYEARKLIEHRQAAKLAAENRVKNIKDRLSNIKDAEKYPLGSKETDLADIRAITAVAIEKKIVKLTYRQARAEMFESAARSAIRGANAIAENTPDSVKRGVRETGAILSIVPNLALAIVFGGQKTIGLDKTTAIGSMAIKATEMAKANWDAAKESKIALLRLPVKFIDATADVLHKVTNSKALGRAVGVVIAVGAAIGIPGVGWAAGGIVTAQTAAGTKAEIERENIDIKKRQLTDLVASSHRKQNFLDQMQKSNAHNIDLHQTLGLSNSALRETPKPTSMYYRAAGTSISAELKTLASVSTNALSMGVDALTGNASGLIRKSSVVVGGAISGFSAQINEDEAKHKLNAEIAKLESIAPEDQDKKTLAERSKKAVIEAKALELANDNTEFKKSLAEGNVDIIKKSFEEVRVLATKECEKEWHIEADARDRAAKDPKFGKAVKEAKGKGLDSVEVKALSEKFASHKQAAAEAFDSPKTTFFSKIKAMVRKTTNIYHSNNNVVSRAMASIGRALGKELFDERTEYAAIAVKNSLSDSAKYMEDNHIVAQHSFGGKVRIEEQKISASLHEHAHDLALHMQETFEHKPHAKSRSVSAPPVLIPRHRDTETISESEHKHAHDIALHIQETLEDKKAHSGSDSPVSISMPHQHEEHTH